jgi:hypothetical protein
MIYNIIFKKWKSQIMVYNHDFEKVKDTIPTNITIILKYWKTDFGILKHYYQFLETWNNLPKNTTNSILILR